MRLGIGHWALGIDESEDARLARVTPDDLQQRAASCVGVERWDPHASRRWWEAHLPDLARPRAIALPDTDHSWVRASASCAL